MDDPQLKTNQAILNDGQNVDQRECILTLVMKWKMILKKEFCNFIHLPNDPAVLPLSYLSYINKKVH